MLTELLNLFNDGKIYSLQDLADRLKTEIPVVKAQLEFLERQGYIKKVILITACSKSCRGCKGCSQSVFIPVMWEVVRPEKAGHHGPDFGAGNLG